MLDDDRPDAMARSCASIGSDGWPGNVFVTLPLPSMVCCTASNSKEATVAIVGIVLWRAAEVTAEGPWSAG